MDATSPAPSSTPPSRSRFWNKAIKLQQLYLLVLPSTCIILLLGYYPKIDVVVKSMFRWKPGEVEEFIGLKNFVDIFNDPTFWASFQLVFILLAANLVKMWPGIFAAVALNRLTSDRLRYIFQVLFVVPMVIPGMVWLLIWKSFYEPSGGLINRILRGSGLMGFLDFLDSAMPQVALFADKSLSPEKLEGLSLHPNFIEPVFGGSWGLIVIGLFFTLLANHGDERPKRIHAAGLIAAASFVPLLSSRIPGGSGSLLVGFVVFVTLMALLARCLGPMWVLWMFGFAASLYAFKGQFALLILWTLIVLGLSELIRTMKERFSAEAQIKTIGTVFSILGIVLLLVTQTWTETTGQFEQGTPAWLGNKDLVIPALLFWGFPWVGTVGVLIYLAGLQQIPQDVYEAAELDGIGPIGMLFRIELPLILTQVRINLIFMTIGTLTAYEMFLILLGPNGGPGGKALVPGLYIFKKAFLEGRFGYACALGMVLFFIVLGLTIIYNKYVKVDK